MKIIFSEKPLDLKKPFHYCHYGNIDLQLANGTFIDFKSTSELLEKSFFDEVEKWHSQINAIGLKKNQYWWLLWPSRLLSWNPPVFTPLFFGIILQKIITDQQIPELYIFSAPPDAITIAREIFGENNIEGVHLVKHKITFNFPFINSCKIYLSFLLKNIFNRPLKRTLSLRPYLIHSQAINPKDLENTIDHFFGDCFFKIPEEQRKKITWLMDYTGNDYQVKLRLQNKFQEYQYQIVFSRDLLNLLDIFAIILKSLTLKKSIRSTAKEIPLFKINNHTLNSFSQIYKNKILLVKEESLSEFTLYQAAKKLFKTSKLKKVLYAYEVRSIENSLHLARQSLPKDVKYYGFVHSVMHDGQMCFNKKSILSANPPAPDIVLVTGRAAQVWFKDKINDVKRVEIIGSPRYSLSNEKLNPPDQKRILFLSGQLYELMTFAIMIKNMNSFFQKFSFTVRCYPYGGLIEQQQGIQELKLTIPHLQVQSGNLLEQLKSHDVVFFASSSAGIEAIFRGKIGINVGVDPYYSLNPLKYATQAQNLIKCSNGSELQKKLEDLLKLDTEAWRQLSEKQILDATQIYEKFNPQIFLA